MAYQQFIQAMAGCLCGFLLAASYDVYRVLFPGRKAHDPRRFAGDLLWWCFAFFGTFILLFFLTWGGTALFLSAIYGAGFFSMAEIFVVGCFGAFCRQSAAG